MTVCIKGLIEVFWKESEEDFIDISRRIRKLDPTIAFLMVSDGFDPKKLPQIFIPYQRLL
jgi:hypothetical protein